MKAGDLEIVLSSGWRLTVSPVEGGSAVRGRLERVVATSLSRDLAQAVESAASYMAAHGFRVDAVALERAASGKRTNGGGQ